MPNEVELIIKANTDQYVKGINDAQKATQELYSTSERTMKREKGLIEDIELEIKKWEEAKKKAWRVEDIEKFNQKIAEGKKDLQDYENAGVNANKNVKNGHTNLCLDSLSILWSPHGPQNFFRD